MYFYLKRGNETEKHHDLLFMIAFGVWLFISVLNTSFYASVIPYNILTVSCLAVLAIREMWGFNTRKQSILGALIVLIAIVLSFNMQQRFLVYTVLFLYFARGKRMDELVSLCFWVLLAALFTVIVSAWLGLITNYVTEQDRVREYMGFRYALYPSQYMFAITCLYALMKRKRFDWIGIIPIILLNCLVYYYTESRLSFILSLVVVFVYAIQQSKLFRFGNAKLLVNLISFCFVILAIVGIAFTVAYNDSSAVMKGVDDFFGGRLKLGHDAMVKYGFLHFGQSIEFVGNGLLADGTMQSGTYNYVDCLYVKLLVEGGPILLTAFILAMTVLCRKAVRRHDMMLLVVLLLIAVHCLVDDLCVQLYFNPFLLGIASLLEDPNAKSYHSNLVCDRCLSS